MDKIDKKIHVLHEEDPYKIIGVAENADIEEISKVYRKLAKEYHPDINIELNGVEKEQLIEIFTKITAAFNLLKDPKERIRYDFEKKRILKAVAGSILKAHKEEETKVEKPVGKPLFDEEAEKTKVDEIKTKQAEGLFSEGLLFHKKNKYDQAIPLFREAIELHPNEAKYHSYLGLAMLGKGWNGYALGEFKIAFKLDNKDPIARKQLKIDIEEEENSDFINKIKNMFRKYAKANREIKVTSNAFKK